MISKAHWFSLRLSLCRLIYLWRSEADIGPEIKISTWETSRFETSLLPDTLHTPREAHKCPYGIPCLQAAKQSSVFLHVCVCVYIYLFSFFFNVCMYVWGFLGVGSSASRQSQPGYAHPLPHDCRDLRFSMSHWGRSKFYSSPWYKP